MRSEKFYLLLDSGNVPLARARLEGPTTGDILQIRVVDDDPDVVLQHELIQVLSMSSGTPDFVGRIITHRGDLIVLRKQQVLGEDVRENLRVPVNFDTYIFSRNRNWKGRRKVVSADLSCRGIAFYCAQPLHEGERMEIVVPITEEPLVLHCQILRKRASNREEPLYAAKFTDMCNDEESMIREAVFSTQLAQRPKKKPAQ